MDANRLLERFLRYVRIDTAAVDGADRYPSSLGQKTLGKLLVDEFHEMGLDNARQDEHGLVHAVLPPTGNPAAATIVFNAHLDTSPEAPGTNVRPQVIREYDGTDLVLPGDPTQVIRVVENPELTSLKGTTIVTSDGTTLLGGDDKAGIAIMMELAAHLIEHPEIAHGPVRILFTCDEEIGRGVEFVDVDALGAVAAYTLDGPGSNKIDVETFSADVALVTVRGVNIHPSIGKDRLVNAVRAAAALVDRLPRDRLSPESTEGRDGFLHPFIVHGGVGQVELKVLLRDFETERLAEQAELLRQCAAAVEADFPGSKINVHVQSQYRNMREGLEREPRAVRYAEMAYERLGVTAERASVRGGTDGSQFTARGLPTPNLASGQHNQHSKTEWVCLDEMMQAVRVVCELAQIWHNEPEPLNSSSPPNSQ